MECVDIPLSLLQVPDVFGGVWKQSHIFQAYHFIYSETPFTTFVYRFIIFTVLI